MASSPYPPYAYHSEPSAPPPRQPLHRPPYPHEGNKKPSLVHQLQVQIKEALDRLDSFERQALDRGGDSSTDPPYGDSKEWEGEEQQEEELEEGPLVTYSQGDIPTRAILQAQLRDRQNELALLKARLGDVQSKQRVIEAKDAALEVLDRVRQTVEDAWAANDQELGIGGGHAS